MQDSSFLTVVKQALAVSEEGGIHFEKGLNALRSEGWEETAGKGEKAVSLIVEKQATIG